MVTTFNARDLADQLLGPGRELRARAYILRRARELAEEDGRENLTEQDVREAYSAYGMGSSKSP